MVPPQQVLTADRSHSIHYQILYVFGPWVSHLVCLWALASQFLYVMGLGIYMDSLADLSVTVIFIHSLSAQHCA
jgi:uncharacterized membrane protein